MIVIGSVFGAVVALAAPLGASSAIAPSLRSDQQAPTGIVRAQSNVALGDSRLRTAVERLGSGRSLPAGVKARGDKVLVEILLSGTAKDARQTVTGFGGDVVGQVGNVLLEAYVPYGRLVALEHSVGIRSLRPPLDASVPVAENTASAPLALIQGDEIAKLNAAPWHAGGFTGTGVKVGIVDYFDQTKWNAAQAAGEVPAPAGTFCRSHAFDCTSTIFSAGSAHGEAVAEVIHELAPGAQIYLASADSVADLQDAVNWFASQGVTIVSRSLTANYDNPGDGTGPMASVVNSAVSQGIAWFNSAGNSGGGTGVVGSYWRGPWTPDPTSPNILQFAPGDDALGFVCGFINGFRWNDWVPTKTDYDTYVYADAALTQLDSSSIRDQSMGGVDPIEYPTCSHPGQVEYLVVQRYADGNGTAGDVLEFMTNGTGLEYWQNPYSAAAPAVDVNSPGAIAVGAIDPAAGTIIGPYSSQGPTNDSRTKPELSAASCVASFTYAPACFNGTSAATPAAAGAAAIVKSAGLATTPAQVKSWLLANATVDRGAAGTDNVYGVGELILPAPPPPPATVPDAPTNVLAVAGDASATVSWAAPASNGGSAITGYVVTPYIGATAQASTAVGNVLLTVINGLTNGTAYTFRVHAVNGIGPGADSAASGAVTPTAAATVPGAPTGVSAVAGDASASVSWTAPGSDGGSAITGYVVTPYVGTTAQASTQVGNVLLTVINGLTNGTAYTFKVHAVNGVGPGADSAASGAVTPTAAATVPGIPTGVAAVAGNASANVSWTAPASDGGSAITGYTVIPYIGATAQTPKAVGNVTSTQITSLTNGTAYTFKVRAVNAVGPGADSAASNSVTPVAPPPAFNWAANPSVDFDGDHRTDMGALYRGLSPADSLWFALSSSGGGPFQIYFGATSDIPVPGDYDGDGRTDAVIFRPATGLWYGPRTGFAQIVIQMNLGQAGDIPIPGDYDGDGKTDPAIWRPSTGLFFAVLSGGGVKTSTFGAPTDVPVPRDYDGDGKTDFAIYRQNATPDHLGLWYSPLSGGGVYQIYFGAPGDIPVPGDYNGDKRAEAVIFREATGLWYGPFNGAPGLFQLQLGGNGDVPIPGYYDNNLSMDAAIYHKATGLWFALLSGGGTASLSGLGLATDVPAQKRPSLAGGL